jgi:hydrogenase nickel incorporation protein HypB
MCSTCGCGQPDDHVKITVPGEKEKKENQENHAHGHNHNAHHDHNHDHHHGHSHDHSHDNRQLTLEQDILYKNNLLAERNRGFLEAKNILALNLVMVIHAIQKIDLLNDSILMIENVGNLVCPSMFDLGEKNRVVIMSVTEGEDKPLKYPDMFMSSQICVINKIDLLPYLEFDLELAKEYALRVNPKLKIFELSATTGEGMKAWIDWLKEQVAK